MVKAQEVLDILDQACREFSFPALDNGYVYPAASRLSLYRGLESTGWAVVIECFGFSPKVGYPSIDIFYASDRLTGRKTEQDYVSPAAYQSEMARYPYDLNDYFRPFDDDTWIDPDNWLLVREGATSVQLRGRRVPLPNAASYRDYGITLEQPPRLRVYEVCRAMAHLHQPDVLGLEQERRRHIPADLPCLLILDEWHHPEYIEKGVLPSGTETFRQLALVLETGEASRYHPSERPNNHWANWPEGGSL